VSAVVAVVSFFLSVSSSTLWNDRYLPSNFINRHMLTLWFTAPAGIQFNHNVALLYCTVR